MGYIGATKLIKRIYLFVLFFVNPVAATIQNPETTQPRNPKPLKHPHPEPPKPHNPQTRGAAAKRRRIIFSLFKFN